MSVQKPIYVTRPNLPPLEEFIPYLQEIWGNRVLTNGGPFHQQLETALCEYLGVQHLSLFANGTLALVTALQALNITGEVITTPYSFVATAHSLMWNGIKPVFVDIDPITFNLDPAKIEAAITPQTTAIMPVHVYGTPCDAQAIQDVADRYSLKIIYDAAHAFGVKDHGGTVLRYGDMSALSFHATKVFNTFEGGAIVCRDAKMKEHVDQLKNFGFVDEVTVTAAGINGKMNELSAAIGLLQLRRIDTAIAQRKALDVMYREKLKGVKGLHCLPLPNGCEVNYSYFPISIDHDFPIGREALYQKLLDKGVHARRYFYPLISNFPMYSALPSAACKNLPVASNVANQILCLPIYSDMTMTELAVVVRAILE